LRIYVCVCYDGQGSNTYQHESGPGYYIEINF
jgi:hypothetical protein